MSGFGINSNQAALRAQRQLAQASARVGTSLERLASGMRINRASDDAAGLAIASGLSSESRVFAQAIRNVNDGISVLHIAEGALKELSNISTRQLELAEQAANGTYSNQQRRALAKESDALTAEFNRINASVVFNGISLFANGSTELRIQAGYGSEGSLMLNLGSELSRTVGDGTFDPVVSYSAGTSPDGLLTDDFNGDGLLDLHISNQVAPSTLLLGNGDGTFSGPISAGGYGVQTITADVNSDGKRDLVMAAGAQGVGILLGNGNGTFMARQVFAGATVRGVQAGDFDGDGIVDVISTDYNNAAVSFFHGNGNGSFAARVTYVSGNQARMVTTADFNNDGRLDVATSNDGSAFRSILLGNGNGTFQGQITLRTTTTPNAIAAADLNRDGFADLVVAGAATGIYFGNGDGTFRAGQNMTGGAAAYYGLALADFTGDGFIDIARSTVSSDTFLFYRGNGDGTFSSRVTYAAPDDPHGIAAGDFNRDGALDIATACFNNGVVNVALANPRLTADAAYLDLSSQTGARNAIPVIQATLDRISRELGAVGALESRLTVTANTLTVARENFAAAGARITDVDVAAESAELVRTTILQQAAAAVLGQANQSPALALQLLR